MTLPLLINTKKTTTNLPILIELSELYKAMIKITSMRFR